MPEIVATVDSDGLTDITLPRAIGHLLELNNYTLQYSVGINGAEVDIIATPKADPFQSPIYIEATVQYVDVTKYGKDLTKFSLIRAIYPNSICLSVSTKGFTQDVRERATKTGILTETYNELFRRFERFSEYIEFIIDDRELSLFAATYEPPRLVDNLGSNDAIAWFDEWRNVGRISNWIVLLGEYGTGKTALTTYLQRMWLLKYKADASNRIPIRIELRGFTRQFDANSLLHHFLDTNNLSHIPMEYLKHLIRAGRIILLLDGYDEMAQFMNARERRACLSALADLADSGAIGILTSRPNYFTESEELNVFDALYSSLEKNHYYSGKTDREALAEEKKVDSLIENYVLNRKERYLRDLDQAQTESLVTKKLSNDLEGQRVVLEILSRAFRSEASGFQQSLSGKPVIISFLLELVDELKRDNQNAQSSRLTEWLIYKMIVDRLMLRDLRRSPNVHPKLRREALQKLALLLSTRDTPAAREGDFYTIIDGVFRTELRRYQGEEKRTRRDELFQDIRSSATLTRHENRKTPGDTWVFSHNSIREYLVAESIVSSIQESLGFRNSVSVSDAMRNFISTIDLLELDDIIDKLKSYWRHRDRQSGGNYISAIWDIICRSDVGTVAKLRNIFSEDGKIVDLSDIELSRLEIAGAGHKNESLVADLTSTELSFVRFSDLELSGTKFSAATLDNVIFKGCNLKNVSFSGALIFECMFIETSVEGADFTNLDRAINFSVQASDGAVAVHSGEAAIGYLNFCGAITDCVDRYYILMHHSKFAIAKKILSNISDQRNSQLRGLTQRGVAQNDPGFARDFVTYLRGMGIVEVNQNDLVSVTSDGRGQIVRFLNHNELIQGLYEFVMGR